MTRTQADALADRDALLERLGDRTLAEVTVGTIVVVPSVTTSSAELARTPGWEHLDERLLFTLLLLRQPELHIVYVTALGVEEAIVDYYLRFLPDVEHARARVTMVALEEPGPRALTYKLLDRPDAIAHIRGVVKSPELSYLLCYKVTTAEHALASRLGLPIDGPDEAHLSLDTKTASRLAARRAGIATLAGEEGLVSLADVERALGRMCDRQPASRAAVIKLNEGFAGRGNAIVRLDEPLRPLDVTTVELIDEQETWGGYVEKLDSCGAVVEELLEGPAIGSSCVQMRIAPTGTSQVVSAYDMLLTGDRGHVFSGCRYPAHERHRDLLIEDAQRLARRLAGEGVHGWFGLDFLVDGANGPVCYLNEINLRMGGGTHPFWMALLASGGRYNSANGEIRVADRPKAYVATDDIRSPHLIGSVPADAIALVERSGLAFDPRRGSGVTLQFLGALSTLGMMGVTCIGDSLEEAEQLHRELLAVLGQ